MPIRDLLLNLREQKSGHALLDTARDLDRAADSADRFGDHTKALARNTKDLDAQIARTQTRIKDLGTQFARSGDRSLFGDIRKERSFLREVQRIRAELDKTSRGGGGGLLGSIPNIGGVPGPAVAGIGAAIVGLSPFIGATIAAAVLGSVGTGGMVGGIALASKDSRVRSAFKDLGQTMFTELGDASAPFVKPLTDAAAMFGKAWDAELPRFQSDFKVLSEAVEPISEGIAGFIHELHPGLSAAFRASIPLAEEFGKDFTEFGGALSDFLDSMADSGPGAKAALHDLFTVTDEGLRELGQGIEFLSKSYEVLRANPLTTVLLQQKSLFSQVTDIVEADIEAWHNLNGETVVAHRNLTGVTPAAAKLNRELEIQADAARAAEQAIERNTKALADYFDTIMAGLDANEHYEQALDDLTDSVKENGRTLDIHTEQGRANRDALEEVVRATKEQYDAGKITYQGYQDQIRALQTMAVKLGLNKDEVYKLIGAFGSIPKQIITDLIVRLGDFSLSKLIPGLSLGGSAAQTAQQGRGGTDFSITPVVRGADSRQFIDMPRRARGGPVSAGRSYLVGEGGTPEILTMGGTSGYVTPTGGATNVQTEIRFGGDTDSAFATAFMSLIRGGKITIASKAVVG